MKLDKSSQPSDRKAHMNRIRKSLQETSVLKDSISSIRKLSLNSPISYPNQPEGVKENDESLDCSKDKSEIGTF